MRDVMKQPPRILHVLPDLSVGGGQQVVLRYATGIKRDCFENLVCYFVPQRDLLPEFESAGILTLFLDHRSFWSWPQVLRRLIHFIRDQGVDLIHIQGTPLDRIYGELAAWRCGIPVVRTLHGVRAEKRLISGLGKFRPRALGVKLRVHIQHWFEGFLERRTISRFTAVSEAVRDSWLPYLHAHNLPVNKLEVIYNGVPLAAKESFGTPTEAQTLRHELGLIDSFPTLINVGRLVSGKGQERLLHMMKAVLPHRPNGRLLLVGDGPERASLERLSQELQLDHRVLFLGQRLDVRNLIRISDLFVFPSTYPYEGLSLVVLEAMAESKPVVTFRLPIFQKLTCSTDGIHFLDEWTVDALADAVKELTSDEAHLRHLGQEARRTVEAHFSLNTAVRRMERLYTSVLSPAAIRNGCDMR